MGKHEVLVYTHICSDAQAFNDGCMPLVTWRVHLLFFAIMVCINCKCFQFSSFSLFLFLCVFSWRGSLHRTCRDFKFHSCTKAPGIAQGFSRNRNYLCTCFTGLLNQESELRQSLCKRESRSPCLGCLNHHFTTGWDRDQNHALQGITSPDRGNNLSVKCI